MKNIFFIVLFILGSNAIFAQEQFNVDVLPTNVGGKAEFNRMFEQELIYPENSLIKKIGAKVTINFVVMKDSSVANVKIVSCGVIDIDKEAMRLFKLYQWVPAVKKGEYVNANWTVNFNFNPGKYPKICRKRGFQKFQYGSEIPDSSSIIYKNPKELPAYKNGNYALQDFINKNLEYPRQAQLGNIQGTVIVRFVIEPNGLVSNVGIAKSTGGGCNEEAIRVFRLLGNWVPGKNSGKIVRTQTTLPFVFQLKEDFKDNSSGEQK
jgi:TonB family protein